MINRDVLYILGRYTSIVRKLGINDYISMRYITDKALIIDCYKYNIYISKYNKYDIYKNDRFYIGYKILYGYSTKYAKYSNNLIVYNRGDKLYINRYYCGSHIFIFKNGANINYISVRDNIVYEIKFGRQFSISTTYMNNVEINRYINKMGNRVSKEYYMYD